MTTAPPSPAAMFLVAAKLKTAMMPRASVRIPFQDAPRDHNGLDPFAEGGFEGGTAQGVGVGADVREDGHTADQGDRRRRRDVRHGGYDAFVARADTQRALGDHQGAVPLETTQT
ncbi:hypothetical protein OHU24_09695 [Streptomyces sp. NBC_00118]|nr:hypothetical protein OG518_36315 [Streptomyces sp. NBC_01397]